MTTKEAFSQLISTRAWYKPLALGKNTGNTISKRFLEGKQLSVEKMEELLAKAGYKVVVEKQWEKKI